MGQPEGRADHRPGDVLARRYLLLDVLAGGGMSVVWRAFDQSLHREVAVKVRVGSLHTGLGDRARARTEARATAGLVHPDIIEIYDYGESVTAGGGVSAFVVMRLLHGRPLAERVAEGPLPWPEAARVAVRLAQVLREVHAGGLVHRDVTAENVLLTAEGPKLLDFGIAAAAGEPDDEHGTPPYVAPERLAGAPAHPAADSYALGVLLFEMVTGRVPYPETTWEQVERAGRSGPPPPLRGVPRAVARLCAACLDAEPGRRPTAAQIADALGTVLADRRHLTLRWSAAAAVLALTAAAWWTMATSEAPTPSAATPTTATPDPTPAPSPTTAPTSRAAPTPTAARTPSAAATTRPSPKATIAPSVRPMSRERARSAFDRTLLRAPSCAGVPSDVALDLRQVVQGAMTSGDTGHARRKLEDRWREGRLPQPCAADLRRRLDDLDEALYRGL